ncbi:hypothetical protein BVRB_4g084750 [Beta vulgaris subsp. vulgaris]|nr:hypothetical protein BVRB_4g084750 [Beta vulgaris subsp. vulgaris]
MVAAITGLATRYPVTAVASPDFRRLTVPTVARRLRHRALKLRYSPSLFFASLLL